MRDDEVIVTLHGERVDGKYALFQTKGDQWMIHRMSPPADPSREPVPHDLKPMLATASECPAARPGELGVRDEVGRHARDHRGRGAARSRSPPGSATTRPPAFRSCAALGDALGRDRHGARRRDRRPRRPRASQLRAAATSHAGRVGVGRAPARGRAPHRLHDLRPALARRPLHVRAPVPRPARAAREARARGPDLADTSDDDRRR